ncbi:acetoacetate decarboxylase family protein [Streptomyces sp. NPDC101152]|uniref:acetoacetate decarboxylase family protein n=1 Tax=Streptomyces sp. NPDC101152 TaxID=3366116 RepID=UPI0038146695
MTKSIMGVDDGTQGTHWLSDGTSVRMPLLTERASSFVGHFLIDAAKVEALMPETDVRPVLVTPEHALITVQVMEYLEKNLDPYREFVCGIPVHRSPGENVPVASITEADQLPGNGTYIVHIAVDSAQALLVGRDVLGFPKVTADVQYSDSATERIAEVSQDGVPIFTLAVERSDGPHETLRRDFHCYSVSPVDNAMYHVPYQLEATATILPGPGHARLVLGSHPVADELRELGVSAHSVGAIFVPQYALVSNLPDKVVPLPEWTEWRSAFRTELDPIGAGSASS